MNLEGYIVVKPYLICYVRQRKNIIQGLTKQTQRMQKSLEQMNIKLNFNVSQYLYDALGVEVTKIYGIKEITALTLFSETGINLKEKLYQAEFKKRKTKQDKH